MGTRKQCREELVTLYTAEGSFTTVLGYAPLDLLGANKVLCIYTDESRHEMLSAHLNNNFYMFFLDVFVKRAGGETTEDTLDDLHEVVRSVVRDNVSNANWNELMLDENSDALFAEVAGVSYRQERHRLLVKVSATS